MSSTVINPLMPVSPSASEWKLSFMILAVSGRVAIITYLGFKGATYWAWKNPLSLLLTCALWFSTIEGYAEYFLTMKMVTRCREAQIALYFFSVLSLMTLDTVLYYRGWRVALRNRRLGIMAICMTVVHGLALILDGWQSTRDVIWYSGVCTNATSGTVHFTWARVLLAIVSILNDALQTFIFTRPLVRAIKTAEGVTTQLAASQGHPTLAAPSGAAAPTTGRRLRFGPAPPTSAAGFSTAPYRRLLRISLIFLSLSTTCAILYAVFALLSPSTAYWSLGNLFSSFALLFQFLGAVEVQFNATRETREQSGWVGGFDGPAARTDRFGGLLGGQGGGTPLTASSNAYRSGMNGGVPLCYDPHCPHHGLAQIHSPTGSMMNPVPSGAPIMSAADMGLNARAGIVHHPVADTIQKR
ncbi:hypothetical protein CXG81DRAFT_24495 [Caulochytrium protostelioides]|uniref:Uncharacterized protein n=1 Tax=Caulochytrium protostelioides TaxID=1555241 RepID=A0A4P9XBW3_9FUNG|nr:hypothetical protein CXG81DRAFT_24495 [Caulochytrium protostelioides]|eukprot:RKP02896.1 hypothetical protein CXG81DRAFT_24495 [Caulochytrium protostelioides]